MTDEKNESHPGLHMTCPFHSSMGERMDRLERAIYGDQSAEKSSAILPTMRRLQAYMDAACWSFRALIAGVPAAVALLVSGRSLGWW